MSKIQSSRENGQSSVSKSITILTASLRKVEQDTKGRLIGTKEVQGSGKDGISASMLDNVIDWIAQEFKISAVENLPPVKLTISIPDNFKENEPSIERIPSGPMEVLFWDVRKRGKMRVPLDVTSLRNLDGDFHLEIRVPGYGVKILKVTPGRALND